MQLQPCVGCRRHVLIDAVSCPFCAAPLAHGKPARDPIGRLSRAAVFIAATTTGCWTSKTEPKHVETQTTVQQDAGVVADAPVAQQQNLDIEEDRQEQHHQNHPCVDTPKGPMCAPYGAPPSRRRVV